MQKVTFSKHQLIKISMTYGYIKHEVDAKNDPKVITSSINDSCIGQIHESCYLVRKIFSMRERSNYLSTGQHSSPIFRVCHKGEGAEQCTLGGGNKAELKEGAFLVREKIQGDVSVGDTPAGCCFVLRELTPMKLFKYGMTMKLKKRTPGNIFL